MDETDFIYALDVTHTVIATQGLKVTYDPLYSMNKFVTNKSKSPQDGAQVFPYMGRLAIMWPSERVTW